MRYRFSRRHWHYRDAFDWYDRQNPRAAERFEAQVERAVARIARFPDSGSRVDDRHRQLILFRYPYSLIYRIESSGPVVVAVAHAKRSDAFWQGR